MLVDIDVNQIMKVLPHRYPMLLIDRIVEVEGTQKIVAIKNVTANEAFFQGHFPGNPIMPGVLLVEAMAQAGAYGILSLPQNQGKGVLFAGIDSVRFRKPVIPGDQVRIEVKYLKGKGVLAKMHGIAKVNGAVVCEGDLMCTVSPSASIRPENASEGIHGTAVIHPTAKIGQNVRIGAYTVIGPDVVIGNNTEIDSNVLIAKYTAIGSNCKILHGTTIGTAPQDFKYKGEKNSVTIGDNTIIREFCTIHLPTGEGKVTSIGSNCMLMTNVHIPHNARIGNNVIISSFVGLAGHAEVGDFVIIGGMTGIHQFVRIGKMAMIGGSSRISQDVPPFMLAEGNPAQVKALNSVGLQRRGVPFEAQVELKKAFKILYKSHHNLSQAVNELRKHCKPVDEIKYLLEFLEKETDRGILKRSDQSEDLLFPDIPELGI